MFKKSKVIYIFILLISTQLAQSQSCHDLFRKFKEAEYKKLALACKERTYNPQHSVAAKQFQKFMITVGAGSTMVGFGVANYKDLISALEENNNEEVLFWFKKLGYDMTIGLIFNIVLSKIISEPSGSYTSKALKSYAVELGILGTDALSYALLFSPGQVELSKRFEELRKSSEFKTRMSQLSKALKNSGFLFKFKEEMMGKVKKAMGFHSVNAFELSGYEFSKKDLSKSEVQNFIMKALMVEIYNERRKSDEDSSKIAEFIHTGDIGGDRYAFFSMFYAPYHLLNVGIAGYIYHTICMGQLNPAAAYTKASVVFSLWSLSVNLIEFPLRKTMIDQ